MAYPQQTNIISLHNKSREMPTFSQAQGTTYCSLAINFMPSSRAPVTFEFKYCLTGAPWAFGSLGIRNPGSGCREPARELESPPLFVCLAGVPVRAGAAGLGAAGAGDYKQRSVQLEQGGGGAEGGRWREQWKARRSFQLRSRGNLLEPDLAPRRPFGHPPRPLTAAVRSLP